MTNLVQQRRRLLTAAIAIPALVFAAAAAWNRAEVLRDGTDAVTRTAIVMHEHAAKVFDTADLILAHVDDRTRTMSREEIAKPETSAFLMRTIAPLRQVVSVWITDADGFMQAGSQPWGNERRILERPFFKAHRDDPGPGTRISSRFVGRATNTASFAVSQQRFSSDGRFAGIIHVALSPEYFENFYKEVVPPFTHAAALARSDGSVLAREPRNPDGQAMVYGEDHPFRAAMRQGEKAGLHRATLANGKEVIFAYRQVGSRPAYVTYAADSEALLHRWRHNLVTYGIVALAASLALILVSQFTLRRIQAERAALRLAATESERRRAMEERLGQTQKMEALGQLAGGVAHDFNNSAAIVLAGLELLQKRHGALLASGGEEVHQLVSGIREGAERGASVTRRLLTFSRREELRARAVDLAKLFEELRAVLAISLPPGLTLLTRLQQGTPRAFVDPGQLRTVLINLVINARDAMAGQGSVTLGAEPVRIAAGQAHPGGLAAGHYVRLYAADTGIGMDKETLERATEPFFTTKPQGQGTGLGLSMAHSFAVQSGGAMGIDSRIGHGTTVSLWLPVAPPADATAPRERQLADSA
ncbi:hybrid sensor histidine kinase/response regulator [Teichococcus oryzae]|uniref:histidine kinase n=1 Tax=Teichococcus oryzae TaxID=1608942 RepID=A0A5B2TB85_9PROT|nr:hybrid sensor histidine kinase/response regulator [Pseudoroseomonas oryzae]KAA2211777.1 hybrid sensor histidine kinase/response regulator [Pseudoroseomonas oryzae]